MYTVIAGCARTYKEFNETKISSMTGCGAKAIYICLGRTSLCARGINKIARIIAERGAQAMRIHVGQPSSLIVHNNHIRQLARVMTGIWHRQLNYLHRLDSPPRTHQARLSR